MDRPLRGQGIGTRIMEELAVRLAGVEEVFLRCDPEQVPFYRRLGYDHKATCLDLIHRGPASRNSHRQGGR